MPINCEFNLSRASAVYYTGEHVSGSITLTASKKLVHVEALSIILRCRSTVNWQELDGSLPQIEHNDSEAITQPAYISYTCNKLHLEQMQQLLHELNLPPRATKCCNFGFELPSELPGNCRLPLGSTSYSLQVVLQRRGKHDKHFEQRLCVRQRIELLDLQPANSSSGTLELCLPRSIYAPGQRISYQLHATELGACHTRLCQTITYRSEQPAAKEKRVQRVLDESSDWTGVLHLPLTAPIMTQLLGEPIEIAYFVEAGEAACSQPLRLPLWVGTVAPPVDVMTSLTDSPALGFVNLALCENDLLCSSLNQLLFHSCAPGIARHGEQLKLLRRQKKRSYVRLALRYFYKNLLPAN